MCLKIWWYEKRNQKIWKHQQFLLARDKLMSEMHSWQFGFTNSTCGPLTKNKERMEDLKKL